jgi:hypothetical protein
MAVIDTSRQWDCQKQFGRWFRIPLGDPYFLAGKYLFTEQNARSFLLLIIFCCAA